MKKQIRIALTIIIIFVGTCSKTFAYLESNFFRPYDVDFKTFEWGKKNLRFGTFYEYGTTSQCRDWDENKVNVLQMYGQYQSSLAMLLGAPKNTTIYNLALKHIPGSSPSTHDDYRGKFEVTGNYKEQNAVLFGKWKLPIKSLPGTLALSVFVPIKQIEFYNVNWQDQTLDVLAADLLFKADISNNLATNVKTLGNLDINENGWKKTGIGDTVVTLRWYKNFKQIDKEYLKNVRLVSQLGISIPTAEQKDEDQALSKSLGNDGAWGIPTRLALYLEFKKYIDCGLEFDCTSFLSTTKVRRLKTNQYQTDFLLLHKGNTTKRFGPEWRFNLFLKAKEILPGLSAIAAYQFLKHDEDRLSPKSNNFNYNIINSAEGLQEWHTHNAIFTLSYNPLQNKNSKVKPQISLFYKIPITGKRAALSNTFGGQIGIIF